MLSDNGTEFRNHLLGKISKQFGAKHYFTVIYHPVSNGLLGRTNRIILDVVHPVEIEFLETLYFFKVEKRRPYDLRSSSHTPLFNVNDYVKCKIKVFTDIHNLVKNKLGTAKTSMCNKQHKRASPISLKVGDLVMIRVL